MKNAVVVLCLAMVVALSAPAAEVFNADFQACVTENDTTLANINLGVGVGSISGLPGGGPNDADIQETAPDKALLLDRFDAPGFNFDLNFTNAIDIDGAVIEMLATHRRSSGDHLKDITFVGLDASGGESFNLVITGTSASGPVGEQNRLAYITSGGTLIIIPEGADLDFAFSSPPLNIAQLASIKLTCTSAGFVVDFARPAASKAWTSGVIPYAGTASTIAKINIIGDGGTDAVGAGLWLDDIKVNGTVASGGGEGEGEGEGEPNTGTEILSNVYPPYIDEGTIVILTAPAGSAYSWAKNGTAIDGAASATLVFDPVTEEDAGDYTVTHDNGSKAVVTSEPFTLVVAPEGTVPAAGLIGLAVLTGACGLGGAFSLRRRNR